MMNEYGSLVEKYWQRKTKVLVRKPLIVPLYPPQFPQELVWELSLVSAVRSRD
jgi:hypothetical protein